MYTALAKVGRYSPDRVLKDGGMSYNGFLDELEDILRNHGQDQVEQQQ